LFRQKKLCTQITCPRRLHDRVSESPLVASLHEDHHRCIEHAILFQKL